MTVLGVVETWRPLGNLSNGQTTTPAEGQNAEKANPLTADMILYRPVRYIMQPLSPVATILGTPSILSALRARGELNRYVCVRVWQSLIEAVFMSTQLPGARIIRCCCASLLTQQQCHWSPVLYIYIYMLTSNKKRVLFISYLHKNTSKINTMFERNLD